MAYAPDAILACFDAVKAKIPSAQLSGIYANKPGYHNSRNQLPGSDYSVQKSYDKEGDGNAAAAIDITMSDADMKKVTQRLIDATKAGGNSGKLRALRSFFGTTNGSSVTGMDVPGVYWITSDPSHLWHVHASSKRKHANDKQAWLDVAAVMTGTSGGAPPTEDDDMKYDGGYNSDDQALTNAWRTLETDEDGSQTLVHGPAKFSAQINLITDGIPTDGRTARVRFVTIDVRKSDGSEKSEPVNRWDDQEIVGSTGGTAVSLVQYGSIAAPPDGYTRRLRVQGYSDVPGVKITGFRWAIFSQ